MINTKSGRYKIGVLEVSVWTGTDSHRMDHLESMVKASSPPFTRWDVCILAESAEGEGFEPPVPCSTLVFKTSAFDHSATPPGFDVVKANRELAWSGEGGIRTHDERLTHTPLAGERLQPLGHLS